jgi:hypothetical protein
MKKGSKTPQKWSKTPVFDLEKHEKWCFFALFCKPKTGGLFLPSPDPTPTPVGERPDVVTSHAGVTERAGQVTPVTRKKNYFIFFSLEFMF